MKSNGLTATAMAGALIATGLIVLSAKDAPAASISVAASDRVDITMAEYSYTHSGTLKAGGTLRVRNAGKEIHMIGIGKLLPGKTIDDVKAALANSTDRNATAKVLKEVSLPGLFMPPGRTVEITAPTLDAGTYAFICFMPAETDGKPHFAHGMVTELTVSADKAALPKADAVYSVAVGKPITGPATLKAGHHVLQIDAAPGTDQLEPALLPIANGMTLESTVRKVDSMFGAKGGLPKGAGAIVSKLLYFGAHDFKSDRRVYLGVDLKPGKYVLGAPDTDLEKKPAHYMEQITIKVT